LVNSEQHLGKAVLLAAELNLSVSIFLPFSFPVFSVKIAFACAHFKSSIRQILDMQLLGIHGDT
jgi:hypothetical protein